jgi:DNA-binding winged helix-turn-helix (wHTH) protein
MVTGRFRFDSFLLDPDDRQLRRDGEPVELNARYLDALALLVREQGRLVSKDRFLEEVWRGVPVTDEALTQCIKTLRRQLGDEAGRPRFIETVPKHGYRFIAAVTPVEDEAGSTAAVPVEAPRQAGWRDALLLGAAGTAGGGVAGIVGGLFYGFAGASQPLQPGVGSASVLIVLICLTVAVALLGAAGVAFGMAGARYASGRHGAWSIAGAAAGGLVVGAAVKLIGSDAVNLLFGQQLGGITGAPEGAMLGAAVGLGAWLGRGGAGGVRLRRSVAAAALAGGGAGILITLLGGRLLGGSLELLARIMPNNRLRLDQIGGLFGESGLGPVSQMVTSALEGALFAACVVGAMALARRQMEGGPHASRAQA